MGSYFIRRFVAVLPVLAIASLFVFSITLLIPGEVATAILGPQATPKEISQLTKDLGLDRPIYVQYRIWLQRVVRGNLGRSYILGYAVSELLINALTNTIILAGTALLIAVSIGIIVGTISAVRRNSLVDRLSVIVVLMSNSMPPFWLGLLLIWFFVAYLKLLPSGGMYSAREGLSFTGVLRHLALPAATLAAPNLAYVTRMTRSCVLEVLHMDYVRTARAKGLPEKVVILKHAVRNALIPLTTMIGLRFGYLLAGSVVTETVFSWPGVGLLMYKAITERDIPVIQGGVLLIALNFALVNLLVDISYAFLNPQITLD